MPNYNVRCTNNHCEKATVVETINHSIKDPHPPCSVCNQPLASVFLANQVGQVQYKGNWFSTKGQY